MPPLSMMIKPASGMCNLRCKYCFYHDVAEHRSVPNTGCMAQQTAHRLIDQALAFAGGEQIAFAFQGGEPLLAGREYFRDFVGYVRRQNKKKVLCFSACKPMEYWWMTSGRIFSIRIIF